MKTNHHTETDQRSGTLDDLSYTVEDRTQAEALLAGENRLLEMLATGCTLSEILDALCRLIENIASGSLCGIVLVDPISNRLKHGAAPSLPLSYNESIHGRPVNIYSGPCAMAAFLKEQVIAADVASDTRWDTYEWRTLAMAHGLRACWSTPIRSSDETVLGTFAIYSREPGSPSAYHQHLIGQITHLATVAIEQKYAEEKLRQSETELRQLIDAVPQHIFVLGPDGSCLYTNQVAREYHGLSPNDPQEDHLAMFIHPDDREIVLSERQRLISRSTPYELEARLLGKDGQYRWFLIRVSPSRDEGGNIIRWYGTRTEIEDRKRAEEKLRQDERELRRITDAIDQRIAVHGPDGKMLYANRVMLEYSGLSLEDVMADDFRARLVHPDDLKRSQDERQHGLERGTPFELELRARRKDGQHRWFLIRYNPLRDEEGRIIRWYSTGTDIDDRKLAEERTQKENLALREEIDQSSMFEEIVGSSDVIRNILKQVAKVAPSDSTVLVLGETGTGKELIARAIHKRSKRSSRAFITVNCAAIPASLIASELF
jgi:PAS domain S-box-containing protein